MMLVKPVYHLVGIKRALAVNDLSWLGLERDEGFQALISQTTRA